MSIIYDALKKVQRSGGSAQPQQKRTEAKSQNYAAYAVFFAMVCLGFLAASLLFNRLSTPARQTKTAGLPVQAPQTPPAEVQIPAAETETKEPAENQLNLVTLRLNGVFFSEEEGYALINNRILKEGDTIEGAVVLRISLEGVELQRGDSIIKLPAQGK